MEHEEKKRFMKVEHEEALLLYYQLEEFFEKLPPRNKSNFICLLGDFDKERKELFIEVAKFYLIRHAKVKWTKIFTSDDIRAELKRERDNSDRRDYLYRQRQDEICLTTQFVVLDEIHVDDSFEADLIISAFFHYRRYSDKPTIFISKCKTEDEVLKKYGELVHCYIFGTPDKSDPLVFYNGWLQGQSYKAGREWKEGKGNWSRGVSSIYDEENVTQICSSY